VISNREEVLQFSYKIEEIVQNKNVSYMEAIVMHCEETGFEIELVAKLVSPNLQSKLRHEAEELHFLPKSNTARLPIV
jgi:hypothetical protein